MELRGGYLCVLGLRFALLCDVAASVVLTVAAAAIYSGSGKQRPVLRDASPVLCVVTDQGTESSG